MKALFDNPDTIDQDVAVETRYILDGATTLQEAIELSKSFTNYLEDLEAEGFELIDAIYRGKGLVSLYAPEKEEELF